MILGWGGLVLSVVALCHGAYQLKRQVSYDACCDTGSAHLLGKAFLLTGLFSSNGVLCPTLDYVTPCDQRYELLIEPLLQYPLVL